MTAVTIRAGGIADLPLVMPVMQAAFDPRFGEAWTQSQCIGVLTMPGSSLHVAEAGCATGFALSRIVFDECELMLLAVSPSLQRNGIGKLLLDRVIADARTGGAATLFLEMRSDNSALALYAAAGFAEVGRRRSYYRGANGALHDAITYRLALT